mmetsp:Transcript_25799/g.38133  ORF Transcript_25799/g.38133 Transcript_25799/m.38133 type:complete len:299 (+) Transcript_25799:2-898(+)
MRLSAEILSLAEQRPNPLGEREIVLRGLAIPAIEHLGATRDAYDAIDFTDNRIARLENFPRLQRLSSLSLSGNVVEGVDAKNLAKNVPNLETLVLTNNRINGLHEIANIGRGCPKLQFLSLVGNPVTRRQHYRLFVIIKIPTLKVLDFCKVKQSERDKAKRLAASAAGAALEGDVKIEAREAAKTFVPGEGRSAEESFITNFTPQQKAQIREMVANASSPAEIEQIEAAVKRGELPAGLKTEPPAASNEPASVSPTSESSDTIDNSTSKRKSVEETENETSAEQNDATVSKRNRISNQ